MPSQHNTILIVATQSGERDELSTRLRPVASRLLFSATAPEAAALLRVVPVQVVVSGELPDAEWAALFGAPSASTVRATFVRVVAADLLGDGAEAAPDAPRRSGVRTSMACVVDVVQTLADARLQPAPKALETSPAMRALLRRTRGVSGGANALIIGAAGPDRELVARTLAERAPGGADGAAMGQVHPFVVVSCAALSERSGARILFGAPGDPNPDGALAQAAGGSLVLDDVGDLHPVLQDAVAQVLDRCPARVISTSRRDLAPLVAAGRFRADLLAQLSTAVLRLPSSLLPRTIKVMTIPDEGHANRTPR